MSNLPEIFQIARDNNPEILWDTRAFFSKPLPRKKAYADVIKSIDTVEKWTERILSDSASISLVDGDHSIDFLYLTETLANGHVKQIYSFCRMIRSEILMAATKEEFEEMKRLQEYWEGLECSLSVLCS